MLSVCVSSFYCDFHITIFANTLVQKQKHINCTITNKADSHSQKACTCMKRPSDVPRLAMVSSPLMKVDIDVKRTRLNWPMNKSTRCKAVVNSVRYSSLRTSQPEEFLKSVLRCPGTGSKRSQSCRDHPRTPRLPASSQQVSCRPASGSCPPLGSASGHKALGARRAAKSSESPAAGPSPESRPPAG